MKNNIYNDYRCSCGKLLFRGLLLDSQVEIKCKNCQKIVVFKGVDENLPTFCFLTFLINEDLDILWVNKVFLEETGYSEKEIIGSNIFDIKPDVSNKEAERKKECIKKMGRLNFDSSFKKKNGEYFLVNCNVVYLKIKGQERFLVFATKMDISRKG